MDWQIVLRNWEAFARAVENIGGEVKAFIVEPPAKQQQVDALERQLGLDLPAKLKTVLLQCSQKVEYRWFFPDDYQLDGELGEIFSGDRHWSLEWIAQFNEDKNGWIREVFPNKDDPYDRVWHNKLAFHEVGNGDYLAIDLSSPGREPIVYLSHEDGEGHGMELAEDFTSFVTNTSRLGCVGAEDWQWLPFMTEDKPFLDPDGVNAKKFRKALSLDL